VEAEKSVSASSRNQQASSLRSPDVQSDKSPSRTGVPRETRALPGRKNWLALVFPGNGMGASQRREGEVNISLDSGHV